MAAPMKIVPFRNLAKIFRISTQIHTRKLSDVTENDKTSKQDSKESGEIRGLAKAFEKFSQIDAKIAEPVPEAHTFASMLRNSRLMQIGDPDGAVLVGTIRHVVSDDLYIDFGGKFECVCKKPKLRPNEYHRGAKVKIRVRDMEMSSKFLGSEKHVTLLEANATLLGLYQGPK